MNAVILPIIVLGIPKALNFFLKWGDMNKPSYYAHPFPYNMLLAITLKFWF